MATGAAAVGCTHRAEQNPPLLREDVAPRSVAPCGARTISLDETPPITWLRGREGVSE
jgi:hypothetical protein